ncbi:MAG: polyphenol oxidase family protein [Patescibacteria group bacterium]
MLIKSALLSKFPKLVHGFSAAADGNMTYKNDIDGNAETNNRRFLSALGINPDDYQILNPELKHGNTVVIVEPTPMMSGYTEIDKYGSEVIYTQNGTLQFTLDKDAMRGIDACFSQSQGCLITMRPADCAVIFVFDPENNVFGLIHAGVAGLYSGIIHRSFETLRRKFGTSAKYVHCYVSPSISAQAYDVTAGRLYKKILHQYLPPEQARHFNPKARAVELLKNADILPEHIELSHECTATGDKFFSNHRSRGQDPRRMLAVIGLR